jgi:hypothetical protein
MATRDELDKQAESLGLNPEDYKNKDEVQAAIDEAGGTESNGETTGEKLDEFGRPRIEDRNVDAGGASLGTTAGDGNDQNFQEPDAERAEKAQDEQ